MKDGRSQTNPAALPPARPRAESTPDPVLQERVDQLIHIYRVRGHLLAQLDPLARPRPQQPELELSHHDITEEDLDRPISGTLLAGSPVQTVRDVLQRLRSTYCRSIGVQFMHIDDPAIRGWLIDRMESSENRLQLSGRQQFRLLSSLTRATVFEETLLKKFIGAKTFSLEGSESLIPLLDLAIERAAVHGIKEIVIAMAHRGRLNVLANIMNKRLADIFREFDDAPETATAGDVKYHLGHSTTWETAAGRTVHLSLCFNPSHLEFINPVALGRLRAKQDQAGDDGINLGLALLIHGDAAIAGQGINQETFNLSRLAGFSVGGTVHVVINNQIGFTTSPAEECSEPYCTAIARMLQIPIFHVNGEDPEAVAQVTQLALDFRRQYKRDVVIDMYGYRRRGHNEMDEPSFTQPLLYRAIRERKTVREGYLDHLLTSGIVTREAADELAEQFTSLLNEELGLARSSDYVAPAPPPGKWSGFRGGPEPADDTPTSVERDELIGLLKKLLEIPLGFHRHPHLDRLVKKRSEMAEGRTPIDWSAAEALAFGTLASEGIRIRMSGQDTARGTFSQRHAVLHDYENGDTYTPLQHIAPDQAIVEIINSPLSESAVLGFEYGYTLDSPSSLVLWEAQYGDFGNAAQVMIDQFIAAAEKKWRRLSGLVLLLPHGFDGQGPEHSSARVERYLNLCAEDNIQVAQPTTPAQYFHLLRRQALRPWRKPLVVFTPKSLLRHPDVVSSLEEFTNDHFHAVLSDPIADRSAQTALLSTGKIYFDLFDRRRTSNRSDVALIRIEQLYPWRPRELADALAPFRELRRVFWVQEEPLNMGAWRFVRDRWQLPFELEVIARHESSSPATGSHRVHVVEQMSIVDKALQ
ncbi:MAG TPA: 2-oxoglutarate dehydrogenase E1 component [Phycisphaerae bacterium]|nr:2-oxoglutarate dehydrogenase E1 component [Phycisphaerae bacterium]